MPRYIDADQIHPDMTVFLSVYSETPVKVYSQEYINKIPSADVAPVHHGRWEEQSDRDELVCSYCNGGYTLYDETPYCPNCGAKMDGGVKEDE